MKNQTLIIIISFALLITCPALSFEQSVLPLITPDPSQPQTDDAESNFDPQLFDAEFFGQIDILAFFNKFTDEDIQKIPPEAFAGLQAEQLQALPPNVFDSISPSQFIHLLPEVLTGMDRERFKFLVPEIMSALTREQAGHLPRQAISGMTEEQFKGARIGDFLKGLMANNMGGLSPQIIDKFAASDFAQLDKDQCRQMHSQDLLKLLTNLNQNHFSPADVKECLPSDWTLDESNGTLTPPLNSRIFLDIFTKPANTPAELKLPDIFNMNSGLAVAGRSGNGNALEGLNLVIEKLGLAGQFAFNQQAENSGILTLEGEGEFQGLEFAFIPDPRRAKYVGTDHPAAQTGFTQDQENGAFTFMTETGMSFPLLPAPKNPLKIIEALKSQGSRGEVEMGDNGVIIVPELPAIPYPVAFICDMLVSSDPGVGPGLHINPLADALNWLVDAQGNAQIVYPALPKPEELEDLGQLFGVDIHQQTDGSFAVLLANLDKYILRPTFDVEARPLADGEQVIPGFGTNSKGEMAFITAKDQIMMIIRLIAIDPDGNTLEL